MFECYSQNANTTLNVDLKDKPSRLGLPFKTGFVSAWPATNLVDVIQTTLPIGDYTGATGDCIRIGFANTELKDLPPSIIDYFTKNLAIVSQSFGLPDAIR